MTRTAEGIKKDVVDSLFWDTRIDASQVKVEVDGGIVTLSGSVPTFEARRAAEEDAWIIEGVDQVRNQVAVRIVDPEPPLEDADLLDRINCVLAWDADVDAKTIQPAVDTGTVILRGRVRYLWEKVRAEQRIVGLAGVKTIRNELEVYPVEAIPDETIASRIVDALVRNLNVEANTVSVKVDQGRVTLGGTVPTHAAHSAAVEAARFTDGVIALEDRIEVRGLPAPSGART